jgi:hypothetical protein
MNGTSDSLRLYHFAATLVAIGIALWAVYFVENVADTVGKNFQQTQCNQGLLTLATLDIWTEHQLSLCDKTLYKQLEGQYR